MGKGRTPPPREPAREEPNTQKEKPYSIMVLPMPPIKFEAGNIVEQVMHCDRSVFAHHPGLKRYARPYVPGEFGPEIEPPEPKNGYVVVEIEQLAPGVRSRRFTTMLGSPFQLAGKKGKARR